MPSIEPEGPIQTLFRLRHSMLPQSPPAAKPPSLRDACYAYVLALRRDDETTPETIESFVNGIELGCMVALKEAWEAKHGAA